MGICLLNTTDVPNPVATVEGCVYERSRMEEWIRRKRQQRAEAQAVLHQNKVRESLYLRLAAEVLPSAALCHQIVLRLLVQKLRCGHDDKFARRILGTHLLLVCDHSNSRDGVWRAA